MSDAALREALASWRSSPTPESLQATLATHRRADAWLPWDLLAASPRWLRHVAFVNDWFERSLELEDGLEPELIEAREAELGLRLPEAVREWYLLLGGRLQVCEGEQRIKELHELEDTLALAVENQAATCWWADPAGGPDPLVTADFSAPAPASEFYLAFLRDQLCVCGNPPGLREGVRWAHGEVSPLFEPELHAQLQGVIGTYPARASIYQGSWGDADTHFVLFAEESFFLVARTAAAWSQAESVLGPRCWERFEEA